METNIGDVFIKYNDKYQVVYVSRLIDTNYAKYIVFIRNGKEVYEIVESEVYFENNENLIRIKDKLRAEQVWVEAINRVLSHLTYNPKLNLGQIKWDAEIISGDKLGNNIDKVNQFIKQFTTPLEGDFEHRKLYKDLIIDNNSEAVYKNGNDVRLDNSEYKVFNYLLDQPNSIHTRQELIDNLWDGKRDLKIVDVVISKIRKKLGDKDYIITKPGKGYVIYT